MLCLTRLSTVVLHKFVSFCISKCAGILPIIVLNGQNLFIPVNMVLHNTHPQNVMFLILYLNIYVHCLQERGGKVKDIFALWIVLDMNLSQSWYDSKEYTEDTLHNAQRNYHELQGAYDCCLWSTVLVTYWTFLPNQHMISKVTL